MSSAITTMPRPQFPFAHLTPEAFENLAPHEVEENLRQLCQTVGTREVRNLADIPVISGMIRALENTSHKIRDLVNAPGATESLLQSLSKRFALPPEHFAAELDTLGCRKWLWKFIQTSGDRETYQGIQDVYALAARVLQETKDAGIVFKSVEIWEDDPSPNAYSQTKQGFLLRIDGEPNAIVTPLGLYSIYSGDGSTGRAALSVSELFIRRLGATLKTAFCGRILRTKTSGCMQ